MPRVILYKGTFAYDAVNVFIQELGAGLSALGRTVHVVDVADAASRAALPDELSRPFECIVSFGAIGFAALPAADYDRLPAPFVAVLVDHPVWQLDRLKMENMIVTCFDRSHLAFLRKYFDGRKRVELLPHGGSPARGGSAGPEGRPVNVLFPGTYMDADAAYAKLRSLPQDVFEVMDFVVERLLVTDCVPLEDALAAVLAADGRETEWKRLCAYLPAVDWFNRAYKRMGILRRLDEAGIPVEILGNHWPAGLFRNHTIRPALPYREVLSLMQRSKIVLNVTCFPDGSHERVFSAMLNGAVPASDYNPYLGELFPDDGDILFYRWPQIEELPARLAALLGERAKLEERSARAPALAKDHTWAARASSLLDFVRKAAGA